MKKLLAVLLATMMIISASSALAVTSEDCDWRVASPVRGAATDCGDQRCQKEKAGITCIYCSRQR